MPKQPVAVGVSSLNTRPQTGRASALLSFFAALTLFATSAFAKELPNYDVLASVQAQPRDRMAVAANASFGADPTVRRGMPVQFEERLGVPTFFWSAPGVQPDAAAIMSATMSAATNATPGSKKAVALEGKARGYLSVHAGKYRLNKADVASAKVRFVHDTGKGPIIVKFQQVLDGVEVYREELSVVMNRKEELVAMSGYLSGEGSVVKKGPRTFVNDARAAIVAAIADYSGVKLSASDILPGKPSRDGYDYFRLGPKVPASVRLSDEVRIKKVLFRLPDEFVPSYYVELNIVDTDERADVANVNGSLGAADLYAYVISSAADAKLLVRKDLSEHEQVTYKVWAETTGQKSFLDGPQGNAPTPHPTGTPDGYQAAFVAASDVTLHSGPISTNDPWLPNGAAETVGNNVDAYVDIDGVNGYSNAATPHDVGGGDFRAQATAPNAFTSTYNTAADPWTATSRQGALQQLFYVNNYLHDWFYDAGFDEVSGNAQTDNFGRGGLGGDSIMAEGQDSSGVNNANMNTPADGARPRMQMYLFTPNAQRYVQTTHGQSGAGLGQFGPQSFDMTGDLFMPNPASGCTAASFTGAAGKVVLVNREPTGGAGACTIGTKLSQAMTAGAAGFILVNSSTSPTAAVNVTGFISTFTIPFLSLSWNAAAPLKTDLGNSLTVSTRMFRTDAPFRDGTIDNQIIAHEWGHYLSNRLVGNASGLGVQVSRGMGEGWSDFIALLMSVKEEDINHPANSNWTGAYAMAGYSTSGTSTLGVPNNGYYYGIRRSTYSADMDKNGLTFRHIEDGQPLPAGTLLSTAANSQVHNTGEVWATMLWESWVSLLRQRVDPDNLNSALRYSFEQARERMRDYVVAGLKLTPTNPTFVEARDGILAAALATDFQDYVHIMQAFALRGMGSSAVAPDRYSATNSGVVESYDSGADLAFASASVADNGATCDADGILDNGETGTLIVKIKNIGTKPLSSTTGTISTTNPNVQLSTSTLSFSSSTPGGFATASVTVTVSGAAAPAAANFDITFTDPQLTNTTARQASYSVAIHKDDVAASTATETLEADLSTPWSMSWSTAAGLGTSAVWTRGGAGLSHFFHGPNGGSAQDQYLVSPTLNVGAGGLTFTFSHRHSFEYDAGGNYDGGRIEISTDGGTVWNNLGASASPTYNGTLVNYTGNLNPLKGLTAYVNRNTSYPNFDTVTVNTGATYANTAVKIRFRLASDNAIGAAGWEVDNIAFSGITNTPFASIVADAASCTPIRLVSIDPASGPLAGGTLVTLNGFGFTPGMTVKFGTAPPVAATLVNASTLTATTPPSATTRAVDVTAISAANRASNTLAGAFSYTSSATANVTVTSALNPANLGDLVAFTATVTGEAGTPTGSVQFKDGSTVLATRTLNNGSASYTTTALTRGMHSITAVYAGNGVYPAATSDVLSQEIRRRNTTSTLVSSAVDNTAPYGTNVVFTVTVAPSAGTGTPTGTVQFFRGTALVATKLLNNGVAKYNTYSLTAGTFSFTAKYAGDAEFYGGDSNAVPHTVTAASTTTSKPTSSANPSTAANPITFSATVTASYRVPSGYVEFFVGGSTIGRVKVVNGTAEISKRLSIVGSHSVTATYLGSPNYSGSTSSEALTQVVNRRVSADITAPDFVCEGSTGNTARVDTQSAVTYAWSIDGGTITAGANMPQVTFTAGSIGPVTLTAEVTCATCTTATGNKIVMTSATQGGTPRSFNADGQADLVWRNQSTGANLIWLMNGSTKSVVADPGPAATNWAIEGAGDFNGDTLTDLILRNTATGAAQAWLMDGIRLIGTAAVDSPAEQGWSIAATGDFNCDGNADLVWRNAALSATTIALMNGYTRIGTMTLPKVGPSWKVEGAGDFNADGRTDLVWRNYAANTGHNFVWLMAGGGMQSSLSIGNEVDLNWDIEVVGDYDGDGKTDLVWRNYSTGTSRIWTMNGTVRKGVLPLESQSSDPAWKLVGPR